MKWSLLTRPTLPTLVVACLVAGLVACSGTGTTSKPEVEPPTQTARPASTTAGPESEAPWLLYQGDGDGRTEALLIRTDGTGLRPLAGALEGGDQTNPDWDPSGTRALFVMNDGATDDLWIADRDGGQPQLLLDCVAPCLYIDDPSWSPNGRSIVFSRTVERHGAGISTLETVDVADGRTRVLLGPMTRRSTAGARWSPDGREIVFELLQKASPAVDADLSGVTLTIIRRRGRVHPLRAITDPALFAATADWSPDGRWIVYSAQTLASDEASDLFLIRPDGSRRRAVSDLVRAGGYAAEPTFTPDGRAIVFSGRLDSSPGPGILLTISLDGTHLRSAFGDDLIHGQHPRLQPLP